VIDPSLSFESLPPRLKDLTLKELHGLKLVDLDKAYAHLREAASDIRWVNHENTDFKIRVAMLMDSLNDIQKLKEMMM